jgi:hypothetical protein
MFIVEETSAVYRSSSELADSPEETCGVLAICVATFEDSARNAIVLRSSDARRHEVRRASLRGSALQPGIEDMRLAQRWVARGVGRSLLTRGASQTDLAQSKPQPDCPPAGRAPSFDPSAWMDSCAVWVGAVELAQESAARRVRTSRLSKQIRGTTEYVRYRGPTTANAC